jgi:hypothetical protein
MNIEDLQRASNEIADAHGFWDDWKTLCASASDNHDRFRWLRLIVNEKLALIHSELSEALEEVRDANPNVSTSLRQVRVRESDGKPEGFPVELADAVIRIADLADGLGINLSEGLALKMGYNQGRPRMHGRTC